MKQTKPIDGKRDPLTPHPQPLAREGQKLPEGGSEQRDALRPGCAISKRAACLPARD